MLVYLFMLVGLLLAVVVLCGHAAKAREQLCVVAIFKNESQILKEWVQHYQQEGVAHFFLIDNGSTDDYLSVLAPYIQQKVVTLRIDPKRHAQAELYNTHCLAAVKRYEWVLVCDLDEFVYARRGFRTIEEYLTVLPDEVSQVFIPWKFFGASGFDTLDKPQPDSVVQNFTGRLNYDRPAPPLLSRPNQIIKKNGRLYTIKKCIARTRNIRALEIHYCRLTTGVTIDATGSSVSPSDEYVAINERILVDSYLHLNHYVIQSLDWFTRVKMTRGDSNGFSDTLRDREYFRSFDINEKKDTELNAKKKLSGASRFGTVARSG